MAEDGSGQVGGRRLGGRSVTSWASEEEEYLRDPFEHNKDHPIIWNSATNLSAKLSLHNGISSQVEDYTREEPLLPISAFH